ncbi:flagellar basal body rod modification protein [Alkalibaculum sp. M08DMB]|uniref:Flagellar basal body rod modification protein n=1 Tax=Alkalibaculum sporogenes TaxID=2655001 RepID=A0A6A7K6F7_9FIRM|nr:flagellar basal body rod modification protein [Alkalibaculum sporogenes]
MQVNNTLAAGQNTQSASTKSSLSVDDFLQIMAAEIRNQNPMGSEGGGSNTDYVSQLAQFTTLEQISDISDSLTLLTLMNQQQYAFTLIGKEVTLTDGDSIVTGVVEKIKFQDGYAMLHVNNKNYNLGAVIEVANSQVEE